MVNSSAGANIILSGVNIDVSGCAFDISSTSGDITITLEGDNVLTSGSDCAGLQKDTDDNTLTIKGSGSLTATGGIFGAGIGGGYGKSGSNIQIAPAADADGSVTCVLPFTGDVSTLSVVRIN